MYRYDRIPELEVSAQYEAGSVSGIFDIAVSCLTVLSAKACHVVVVTAWAKRKESLLYVVRIVAKVRPSLASCVLGQGVIHGRDRFWSIDIGHIGAECEEILGS